MTFATFVALSAWSLTAVGCVSTRGQHATEVEGILRASDGPAAQVDVFEKPTGITMVQLERDRCFGSCPQYSVQARRDGFVDFEGKSWVKELGHREGRLGPTDFERLVRAVESAGFERLPSEFPPDACEEFATCDSTLWITVMKGSDLKRVRYYFGCIGGPFKDDFARFVALGATIDEIIGTSRWVGAENERLESRCLQYEPEAEKLEGLLSYRTFRDASGREERYALLLLDGPVCVEADPSTLGLNVAEDEQLLVQLNMNPEEFGREQALSGRRAIVTGSIYHAHSAHHHTPLLLTVERLELKESQPSSVQPQAESD